MPNFPNTPSSLLTACLLLNLLISPAATTAKTKVDQVRPKPKTTARPAHEAEKKNKRGAPTAKASATKSKADTSKQAKSKGKNADKQLATTRNQHNKPVAKASNKAERQLANKSGRERNKAANTRSKAGDNQLTSRLPGAKLVPVAFVANGQRGKFGKSPTPARRDNDVAPPANPPRKETAQVARPTEHDRAPSRVEERDEGNVDEQDNSPSQRRLRENNSDEAPTHNITLPDKIEVTEYGATSPTLNKLLTVPDARPLTPFGAVVTRNGSQPGRRHDLSIPQQRVLEIQYELAKRGFYKTEPNGVYDETTVQAMWEFQKNYGLPATGYPTAHSLKRLGLTSW
jgi:hypothetical protein